MKTTIDKAGRLVIPRGLRAQVGLTQGGEVEIGVTGAAILIEPAIGDDDLLKEGPFIVIPSAGTVVTDEDVRDRRLADQR